MAADSSRWRPDSDAVPNAPALENPPLVAASVRPRSDRRANQPCLMHSTMLMPLSARTFHASMERVGIRRRPAGFCVPTHAPKARKCRSPTSQRMSGGRPVRRRAERTSRRCAGFSSLRTCLHGSPKCAPKRLSAPPIRATSSIRPLQQRLLASVRATFASTRRRSTAPSAISETRTDLSAMPSSIAATAATGSLKPSLEARRTSMTASRP